MKQYALQTWCGTFVYWDRHAGDLRHGRPDRAERLLILSRDDAASRFEAAPKGDYGGIAARVAAADYAIQAAGPECIALKVNGWVAANRDGALEANRAEVRDWEVFRLVDAETLKRRLYPDMSGTLLARARRNSSIPRHIHQTFPSKGIDRLWLPGYIASNVDELKAKNRNYQHTIWTDKEILDAIYDWYGYDVLDLYLKINPRYGAARADFFRYLLIYKLGGVYLDIKSNVATTLDDVFSPDDGFVLSFWGPSHASFGMHPELQAFGHGEYQQWFIISEAGHPFLAAVIEEVSRRIDAYDRDEVGIGKPGVLSTTGPIAYTHAIYPILNQHKHRFIDSEAAGLIYNNCASNGTVVGRHYSEQTDDIVLT